MDVSIKKKEFESITLNIGFDTKEEIEAFYSVFNHVCVTDFLGRHGINCGRIRDTISGEYGKVNYHEIFNEFAKFIRRET